MSEQKKVDPYAQAGGPAPVDADERASSSRREPPSSSRAGAVALGVVGLGVVALSVVLVTNLVGGDDEGIGGQEASSPVTFQVLNEPEEEPQEVFDSPGERNIAEQGFVHEENPELDTFAPPADPTEVVVETPEHADEEELLTDEAIAADPELANLADWETPVRRFASDFGADGGADPQAWREALRAQMTPELAEVYAEVEVPAAYGEPKRVEPALESGLDSRYVLVEYEGGPVLVLHLLHDGEQWLVNQIDAS